MNPYSQSIPPIMEAGILVRAVTVPSNPYHLPLLSAGAISQNMVMKGVKPTLPMPPPAPPTPPLAPPKSPTRIRDSGLKALIRMRVPVFEGGEEVEGFFSANFVS